MTPILSETRERLLKMIIAQVPPERITEIHFFAPIKQGGVESGVAVVAAVPESVAIEAKDDAEVQRDAEVPAEPLVGEAVSESADAVSDEPVESSAEETASEAVHEAVDEMADEPSEDAEDVGTPDATPAGTSSQRHVIYTARYRYTLKGPDRGKWETNIKAEADAPLITVETVVRGVQRRVGDVDEPERMTGDDIRAITAAWATAALKAVQPGTAQAAR